MDAWFRSLQLNSDLSLKSLNLCLNVVKGVFNWGLRRQFVESNPASPVQALQLEQQEFTFWSEDDVVRFLAFVAQNPYKAVYIIALNTGMRLGEITGLQWDMVDLRRRILRVTRTYCNKEKRLKNTTKGRKARSIPSNETLHQCLVERKLQTEGPWVVTEPTGKRLDSLHFTQNVFRPTCKEAGVQEVRFHDLRHTFASHFVMNGGDLYILQKILGHHSVTMTEKYAHLSPDYLQEASGIVEFGSVKKEGKVISFENYQEAIK